MRYIVGLLSLMFTCVALSTLAVAATSIEGSWIGPGTVSHGNNVDRVQCRVRYTKSSENSYATSSICTTENGRYEVSGHVTNMGGNRYQGTVTSSAHAASTVPKSSLSSWGAPVACGSANATRCRESFAGSAERLCSYFFLIAFRMAPPLKRPFSAIIAATLAAL